MSLIGKIAWPAALATLLGGWAIAMMAPDRAPSAPKAESLSADGTRIAFAAGHYPALVLPEGRRQGIRSLLNVRRPMQFGDFVWNAEHVPEGTVWVRIDLGKQLLSVFRDGHEIGTTVILYGTDGKPTPTGIFPVLERAVDHRSTLYDAEMPYMLRLTGDGVAIHASNVRQGSATHGCIGVPLSFARLLYSQIKRGDLVAILPAATGAS